MTKAIPILYPAGTPEFPRLCVASAVKDGPPRLFWNKDQNTWVEHECATLYINLHEAVREIRAIQQAQYAGLPVRTFTIPIEIEFYGDLDLGMETLRDWLVKAIRFTIDYGNLGNGPTDTTLVLPIVHWDQMQEIKDPQETDG